MGDLDSRVPKNFQELCEFIEFIDDDGGIVCEEYWQVEVGELLLLWRENAE
jgi:hypothetical protein